MGAGKDTVEGIEEKVLMYIKYLGVGKGFTGSSERGHLKQGLTMTPDHLKAMETHKADQRPLLAKKNPMTSFEMFHLRASWNSH